MPTFLLAVVQGASLTTKPLDGRRCSSMAAAAGLLYAIFASFSTTSAICSKCITGILTATPTGKCYVFVLTETYIFFFQVKKVVDGFIHEFWASYDCHKVWVSSSALGKPEINLKGDVQSLIKNMLLCKKKSIMAAFW